MKENVLSLEKIKILMDIIEYRAGQLNKKVVIAVCNEEGNLRAVHAMDGAFLVSTDVAVKKAYSAVAVKMSTLELQKLAQPGGTFYGVENANEKILTIGGGIPLEIDGKIIGGLGISGGTGEEDHGLALFGLEACRYIFA